MKEGDGSCNSFPEEAGKLRTRYRGDISLGEEVRRVRGIKEGMPEEC